MNLEQNAVIIVRTIALVIFLYTFIVASLAIGVTLTVIPDDFSFYDTHFVVTNRVYETTSALIASVLLYVAAKPIARFICKDI